MDLEKVRQVAVVPPNNDVKTSSRKCRPGKSAKARRGIEPMGENGVIYKAKKDMKRMFTNGN